MAKDTLTLMSRETFAGLTLHEKNAYLQQLSDEFAAAHNRETVVLNREALSRLRRYYSRRVWADLKLDEFSQGPLRVALRSLGDRIRMENVQADVTAALMQETTPRRVLRTAPPSMVIRLSFSS